MTSSKPIKSKKIYPWLLSGVLLSMSALGQAPEPKNNNAKCPARYSNPLIWEDLPDPEIIRVDNTYYYSASSFHHSPGAPLLRSYDLVHWEYVSHSVPRLDFNEHYDLKDGGAYVNGIWASSLQYRASNKTFYWMGCMHNEGGGYVYTAKAVQGPWQKQKSEKCYYDMGLLIDPDSDKLYVAWGNNDIHVSELSDDGFSEKHSELVFTTPSSISGPLEGSRFYKINGDYYIFMTQYANGEYVARSTKGPFGPYEIRPFAVKLPYAGKSAGHSPHQGGIVQTQNGDWYYLGFNDAYPAGRLPVMAPVTWQDGWPQVELVNGQWADSYPFPNLPCAADNVKARNAPDNFSEASLDPAWEWNHNPDDSKWSLANGLTLQTATVTQDFYSARNTLTRRIPGPIAEATMQLDYSNMRDGDIAGLAALRDKSAWIGVEKINGQYQLAVTQDLNLDQHWKSLNDGKKITGPKINGGKVWLRIYADVRTDESGGWAKLSYSTDGKNFKPLGGKFVMKRDWPYFLGYRFGVFNYATKALGGEVRIVSFAINQ